MEKKISEKDYVVLDVETNGMSSLKDDLLSISIYKPDDQKIYNRFLPLELMNFVWTTDINGITREMLEDKKPLTQKEFDNLIIDFELEKRTILTYGNIDEKFIKNYLKRKKIIGFEKLTFYNFKRDIIASGFSEGNITKDNLCNLYGIENVQKVHSGINDCKLEWELFKKMNKNKLIVIRNDVYELNKDYIIPVSYLTTYYNFKFCDFNLPQIHYELKKIKEVGIASKDIKRFENNISGMAIEHLINSMIEAKNMNIEAINFQLENIKKLKKIGTLPSMIPIIPIIENLDGTISALNEQDKERIDEINKVTEIIKERISPLIDYIKNCIFDGDEIMSQELVVNKSDNILAKCDLSTKSKVLEIKSFLPDIEKIKYQLYYEANGREIYILETQWDNIKKKGLTFILYKVEPSNNADATNKVKKKYISKSLMREKIAKKVEKYFDTMQEDQINRKIGYKLMLGSLKLKPKDSFNYRYFKEYIEINNIDLNDLAEKIEVSKNAIKNWISGRIRPHVWNIMAISVWLKIDENNLIIYKK